MKPNELYEHYRTLGFSKKMAIEMAKKKINEQERISKMDSRSLIKFCINKPKCI